MKQLLATVALVAAGTEYSVAETNEIIFNRLKSPASVCVAGDPCAEEAGKVLAADNKGSVKVGVNTVKMLNSSPNGTMLFEPAILNIAVGESVTFEPTDGGHNSASVAGLVPDGADEWQGALGEEIKITFEKEGVYVYQCTPHVMMAMVGVITVGSASNLDQIIIASKELEQNFIMNKDRLTEYLSQVKP